MEFVQPFDPVELRKALGNFVSGVTVITCADDVGGPVGLTVSSFCSLSLEPPLVLWCLARDARSTKAFIAADHFAVHVLAADQAHVAEKFATRGAEKFAELEWVMSDLGVPVIDHCAVRFECRRAAIHEGGDHLIVIGEVERFIACGRPPLAYHKGCYALTVGGDEASRLSARQDW